MVGHLAFEVARRDDAEVGVLFLGAALAGFGAHLGVFFDADGGLGLFALLDGVVVLEFGVLGLDGRKAFAEGFLFRHGWVLGWRLEKKPGGVRRLRRGSGAPAFATVLRV